MTCQTLELGDGKVVHINRPGRMKEIHREELGERWCFTCRKRTAFAYTLEAEVEPSYYGPNPSVRCEPRGHLDGDMFPGYSRTWDE